MKLTELLADDGIVLGLHSPNKRSALQAIASKLAERTGKNRCEVLDALLRRERLGSTAVGNGMAIPHARLAGRFAPAGVIATLNCPVWFDALDDGPVDLLLGILWPSEDAGTFLPALSHLSRVLRQPAHRARIRGATSPADAQSVIDGIEAGIDVSANAAVSTTEETKTWAHCPPVIASRRGTGEG